MLQQQEELAQRGQELYESGIRQQIEAGNDGKIVAIDIETGEFEVDETMKPSWVQPIGCLNASPTLNLEQRAAGDALLGFFAE